MNFKLLIIISLLLPLGSHAEIYQWTDEHGITHFGDRAHTSKKQQGKARQVKLKLKQQRNFDLDIIPINYPLSRSLEQKVQLAIRKIHQIYTQRLGLSLDNIGTFTLKIFGTQQDFQHYRKQHYPNSKSATGIYSSTRKEAIVWRNKSVQHMMSVITHEMSHALLDIEYPHSVPTWINEGLAEYFENMRVAGQGITVPKSEGWLRQVRRAQQSQRLPSLRSLLSWGHKKWRRHDSNSKGLSYAQSWTLMYFLMRKNHQTGVVKALLNDIKTQGKYFSSTTTLEKHYPGGITQLESDWEKWTWRDFHQVHQY